MKYITEYEIAKILALQFNVPFIKASQYASTPEVIRLLDGPVLLTSCETPRGSCDHSVRCNVREPLRRVHDSIMQLLASLTISELTREEPPVCAPYAAPAAGGSALQVL